MALVILLLGLFFFAVGFVQLFLNFQNRFLMYSAQGKTEAKLYFGPWRLLGHAIESDGFSGWRAVIQTHADNETIYLNINEYFQHAFCFTPQDPNYRFTIG